VDQEAAWRGLAYEREISDALRVLETRWGRADHSFAASLVRVAPGNPLLRIRVQLSKENRLAILPRPDQKEFPSYAAFDAHPFVDKEGMLRVLATVFHFPFKTSDDFKILASDGVYAGVEVVSGTIWSRYVAHERQDGPIDNSDFDWYDEVRFLLTDSDPQYLCIGFDLRGPGEK
jgi:hypothetical protein